MASPLQITVTVEDGASREFEAAGRLLEAAKATPSNLKRNAGESLTDYGRRLKTDDRRRAQAAKPAKTRSGGSQDFERQHPRGRGGAWVLKQGASGDDVRGAQRIVGAKSDGKFGEQTATKVRAFQRAHGLQVDGVVGAQTIAAMRGDGDAASVKPGKATGRDRRWLRKRSRRTAVQEAAVDPLAFRVAAGAAGPLGVLVGMTAPGVLGLRLDESLRVIETGMELHEEADLALVETVDGASRLFDVRLLEATAADTVKFNADGTVDMVIIRPCHGRGQANAIYEAAMLERDAGVFSGWPSFDNHESEAAARARRGLPRPPSELAGEIRESWWDPAFVTQKDSEMGYERGAVIGRFMLTEDMEKLVRRLPGAVKVSVNATPTGFHVGSRNGKRGLIVEGIVDDPENSSVDLVTKAGAGGQVASVLRQIAA